MNLLDESSLARSEVVANARMNRQRGALGVNSYERELGLNPIDFLCERLATSGSAAWLDVCCGLGRALIDAASWLLVNGKAPVSLHGVDLVYMFDAIPQAMSFLKLEACPLHEWNAPQSYDLVTCVHGLHYIGDKLGAIERATRWISPTGTFLANLDLANLRDARGDPLRSRVLQQMRACGIAYDGRRHVLRCDGSKPVSFGVEFLGASDTAGPNYSGHEAVDSYYRDDS